MLFFILFATSFRRKRHIRSFVKLHWRYFAKFIKVGCIFGIKDRAEYFGQSLYGIYETAIAMSMEINELCVVSYNIV